MSFLRTCAPLRTLIANIPKTHMIASLVHPQQRSYAHQSYGGGEGDPKGENPQQQGSNPSADLEHPGPPPPDVGKGTGGGPTKASGIEESTSTGTRQSSSGAQPKILDESPPAEPSEEVQKHNRDMEQRHDKASSRADNQKKDKVGKGYWSGHGGADREP